MRHTCNWEPERFKKWIDRREPMDKKISEFADAIRKMITVQIREQQPQNPKVFSQHQILLGLNRMKYGGRPHQGDREINRRRNRILSGKLTECDGLIRVAEK
jgi:hypothetical protein